MKVTSITLENGRARIVVDMLDVRRYMTSHRPDLPGTVLEIFPHMHSHKCDNYEGLSFADECMDTEVAHLFEHLVNELQLQMYDSGKFAGETSWDWTRDPRGRFHVETDYRDEVVLIAAVRTAESIIRRIDRGLYGPDEAKGDLQLLRTVKNVSESLQAVRFRPDEDESMAA